MAGDRAQDEAEHARDAERGERRGAHLPGAGEPGRGEPQRPDAVEVGAPHAVRVVVGVVHTDLERERDSEGEQRGPEREPVHLGRGTGTHDDGRRGGREGARACAATHWVVLAMVLRLGRASRSCVSVVRRVVGPGSAGLRPPVPDGDPGHRGAVHLAGPAPGRSGTTSTRRGAAARSSLSATRPRTAATRSGGALATSPAPAVPGVAPSPRCAPASVTTATTSWPHSGCGTPRRRPPRRLRPRRPRPRPPPGRRSRRPTRSRRPRGRGR